jgi:SAM-dependent methyltransferase
MKLNRLHIDTQSPVKLHVHNAQASASNWLNISGWVTGVQRGGVSATSSWGSGNCVVMDRPDVCLALGLEAELAWGFVLHLLDPTVAPAGQIKASLSLEGAVFAYLDFSVSPNELPCLPFATPAALALIRGLYRDPVTGEDAERSPHIQFLPHGTIEAKDLVFGFENTRIGNYHPDILEILSRPGAIGLDIGCGLRDRVFDNLVTQDIYPTPTATIITKPEDSLPFADGVFDLILLDSVLEHVPDVVALLTEARRLLKPGGMIFGDVPFLQPLHLAPHHYYNFTPYGLEQTAIKAGLHLEYVAAEAHQRPEFTLEWLLRRTFDSIPPPTANLLRAMTVGDLLVALQSNKNLIPYPDASLTELAAGFRFHMAKF